MIAFFGMGLLGSGFVRALARHGHAVQVWNRSHAKATALATDKVRAFDDPAEAARGATRIHLTLSDDAAVDAVLERARSGMAEGTVIVDHTTTSTAGALERATRWQGRGIPFVHAPVFMGPSNALEGTGIMLVSGDAARVEALRPLLEPMTGKLVYLGPRPDAAAAFKLLGNSFLMVLTAGLSDMLALGNAMFVPPTEAAKLFEHFNPGVTIGARLARMLAGPGGTPSWTLGMARKDARLMIDEAARAAIPLTVLPAIAARMDAVIAEGHADDDWTVIAKDALGHWPLVP
jgi:3-hydroxyisobutyrate dehydrogenase